MGEVYLDGDHTGSHQEHARRGEVSGDLQTLDLSRMAWLYFGSYGRVRALKVFPERTRSSPPQCKNSHL